MPLKISVDPGYPLKPTITRYFIWILCLEKKYVLVSIEELKNQVKSIEERLGSFNLLLIFA